MSKSSVKWPRISGSKCIEKWEVETDSGTVQCRTYMNRTEESTLWCCVAHLGDDEFLRINSRNRYSEDGPERLDDLVERFRAEVRERVSVAWKPHLYVQVSSSYLIEPEGVRKMLFDDTRPQSLELEIRVARVDLGTTGSGEKRHRGGMSYYDKNPKLGWPEVGRDVNRGGFGAGVKMLSLVEDTPANREAIEAIREGMQRLNTQLQVALSPEHVEKAFANVHKLLPSGAPQTPPSDGTCPDCGTVSMDGEMTDDEGRCEICVSNRRAQEAEY